MADDSLPENVLNYFEEIIYYFVLNISEKDIQIGAKFLASDGTVNLSKLESSIKTDLLVRSKKAIGKGVKDDTAKAQHKLYKELFPKSKLKWRDFLKDSEKKPYIFKPKPLTQTQYRRQISDKIRSYTNKNSKNLRGIIRAAVRHAGRSLNPQLQTLQEEEDSQTSALKAGAISMAISTVALNRVGFDGPVFSGGVSILSGLFSLLIYKGKAQADTEGSTKDFFDSILSQDFNLSSLRKSVRTSLQFSS